LKFFNTVIKTGQIPNEWKRIVFSLIKEGHRTKPFKKLYKKECVKYLLEDFQQNNNRQIKTIE